MEEVLKVQFTEQDVQEVYRALELSESTETGPSNPEVIMRLFYRMNCNLPFLVDPIPSRCYTTTRFYCFGRRNWGSSKPRSRKVYAWV
jgi:hypothetical protein